MKTNCPKCSLSQLSLANAKINVGYTIKNIDNDMLFKIKRRIIELGFFSGAQACVLKKSMQGKSFLVSINGCVFCIRKDVAEKIYVEVKNKK